MRGLKEALTEDERYALAEHNGRIEVHSSLLNVILHDQPQIKT